MNNRIIINHAHFKIKFGLAFILPLLLFVNFNLNGQVLNIDRENGQDTIPKKLGATLGLDFSSDKQQKDFVEFSSSTELDFFLKNDQLIVLFGQLDMAFNGDAVIENNGFFMARYRDNDSRRIYPDLFLQYQWNGVLGMQSRALGGANARVKLFEKENIDAYSSVGLFYENELWDAQLSNYTFDSINENLIVDRNLFRLNTHAKFAFEISEKIDFAMTHYIQFPLNESLSNFNQPRWFMNSDLFFEINKNISFNIHYDHTLDYFRALPIDLYYYNLHLGIQLTI